MVQKLQWELFSMRGRPMSSWDGRRTLLADDCLADLTAFESRFPVLPSTSLVRICSLCLFLGAER